VVQTFHCSSNGDLETAWVRVVGALDVATTPRLKTLLRKPHERAQVVVLDLRRVTSMDYSGLHAIVDASAQARHEGRRMIILRGPPDVDCMFTPRTTRDDVEVVDLDGIEEKRLAWR
jgi:anti-anti-sigma factor